MKMTSQPARFWANVDRRGPDECWPWTARRNRDGYGIHRDAISSRCAWVLRFGAIPDSLLVLHECDNPPCCNPAHLFIGTQTENMADMARKGRAHPLPGSENGRAKITEDDIIDIRTVYALGAVQREIAEAYEMTQASVSKIITGRTWRHV